MQVQKQGRSLPPWVSSSFLLRLRLFYTSPPPLCHSTFHSRLLSSRSLPDLGRGAALLLRAKQRGLCG